MKKGICKLCLQEKYLCKESHIIPSSLYKLLHGPNKLLVYIDDHGSKFKYNSEYEGGILCEECDNYILGKLDDYAAKFLHGGFKTKSSPHPKYIDGRECLVFEDDSNYNYSQFKTFLLSLLWRASISSRPFFKAIKLSPKVEEDLRVMIKDGIPGEPEKYACFIYLPPLIPTPGGGRGFDLFYMPTMSPQQVKKDGFEFCEFTITGTKYYFLISYPANLRVLPGIDRNKLTMAFTPLEEQNKLIEQILNIMKKYPRKNKKNLDPSTS